MHFLVKNTQKKRPDIPSLKECDINNTYNSRIYCPCTSYDPEANSLP